MRTDDLELRLARLEAKEHVLGTFNMYLYCLDRGYPEELVKLFDRDAVLHLVNFPPGTHEDHDLTGREIVSLYTEHTAHDPVIQGGHHAANVGVNVAADCSSAEVSAYFLTAGPGRPGVQGGMYQLRLHPSGGEWKISEMNIISSWGWRPPADGTVTITGSIPARVAWRHARPVRWEA